MSCEVSPKTYQVMYLLLIRCELPCAHLEDPTRPESPAKDIVQRPRDARLPPSASIPPRPSQFRILRNLQMCQGDEEPLDLEPERGLHFACGESRIPVRGSLHARRPGGIELRAERS